MTLEQLEQQRDGELPKELLEQRDKELFEALTAAGNTSVTLEEIKVMDGTFPTADFYFELCEEHPKEAEVFYEKALQYYSTVSVSSKEAVRLQVAKLWYETCVLFRKEKELQLEMRPFDLELVEFAKIGVLMSQEYLGNAGSSAFTEKLLELAVLLKKLKEYSYLGDYLMNLIGWVKNCQDVYLLIVPQLKGSPESAEGAQNLEMLSTFLGNFTVGTLQPLCKSCAVPPKVIMQMIRLLRSFRQAMIRENELFSQHTSEPLEALLKEHAGKGIFYSRSRDDQEMHLAELKEYESRQEINLHLLATVLPKIQTNANLLKIFNSLISVPSVSYRHFEIICECFKSYIVFDDLKELFIKNCYDGLENMNLYVTQKRNVDVSVALEAVKSDIQRLNQHQKPSSFLCC